MALLPKGVWAVGGAVRDALLDIPPADLDLVTVDARSAAHRFAARASATFVDLGRDTFPTFRVVAEGRIFDFSELTGGSIIADLGRRDFTINAMAIDLTSEALIDPFDGTSDLRGRIVRMVREQNLIDDPLRILKMVRTACSLGFTIEASTLSTGEAHGSELSDVAGERLRSELVRALDSERAPLAVHLLREMNLDGALFSAKVATETTEVMLSGLPAGRYLVALSVLLRSFDTKALDGIAARLRLSVEERRALGGIRALSLASESSSDDVLRLMMYESGCVISAMAEEFVRRCGSAELAARLTRLHANPGFFDTEPLMTGSEIAHILEIVPGPEIGRVKRAMLTEQLAGRIQGREQAMAFMISRRSQSRE